MSDKQQMPDRGSRFMRERVRKKKGDNIFCYNHLQAFSFAGRFWFFIFG
jgi:hypothetical protein